jgi:WD40 repeat protein
MDANNGEILNEFTGTYYCLSPDGRVIAVVQDFQTIVLFDAITGRELRRLEGHTDLVGMMTFSPDGSVLASCSRDGTIRIWGVSPDD